MLQDSVTSGSVRETVSKMLLSPSQRPVLNKAVPSLLGFKVPELLQTGCASTPPCQKVREVWQPFLSVFREIWRHRKGTDTTKKPLNITGRSSFQYGLPLDLKALTGFETQLPCSLTRKTNRAPAILN